MLPVLALRVQGNLCQVTQCGFLGKQRKNTILFALMAEIMKSVYVLPNRLETVQGTPTPHALARCLLFTAAFVTNPMVKFQQQSFVFLSINSSSWGYVRPFIVPEYFNVLMLKMFFSASIPLSLQHVGFSLHSVLNKAMQSISQDNV